MKKWELAVCMLGRYKQVRKGHRGKKGRDDRMKRWCEETGISLRTMQKVAKIRREAPELLEKAQRGELSFEEACQQVEQSKPSSSSPSSKEKRQRQTAPKPQDAGGNEVVFDWQDCFPNLQDKDELDAFVSRLLEEKKDVRLEIARRLAKSAGKAVGKQLVKSA